MKATCWMGKTQVSVEDFGSGDIDPTFVVTHRMSLEDAPHAYEIFKHKQDNCIKVVLKPG